MGFHFNKPTIKYMYNQYQPKLLPQTRERYLNRIGIILWSEGCITLIEKPWDIW